MTTSIDNNNVTNNNDISNKDIITKDDNTTTTSTDKEVLVVLSPEELFLQEQKERRRKIILQENNNTTNSSSSSSSSSSNHLVDRMKKQVIEWVKTNINSIIIIIKTDEKIWIYIIAFISILCTSSGRAIFFWMIYQLYTLLKIIIGTTIGIGIGLGLAGHVYEQLQEWDEKQQKQKQKESSLDLSSNNNMNMNTSFRFRSRSNSNSIFVRKNSAANNNTPAGNMIANTMTDDANMTTYNVLEDEQTYHSLMISAGYHIPKFENSNNNSNNNNEETSFLSLTHNRGQVLKLNNNTNNNNNNLLLIRYPYTANVENVNEWRAVISMKELWPTLPIPIQESLGKAIEYIIRDFVACWYYKADPSCIYPPQLKDNNNNNNQKHRTMLYKLNIYRPIPFMNSLYESCSIIFGNLAIRVEHVNIFELILLKWTRILAYTFKWYRSLRKHVKQKQLAHLHQKNITSQNKNQQQQQNNNKNTGGTVTTNGITTNDLRRQGSMNKQKQQRSIRGRANTEVLEQMERIKNEPVSEIAMIKEFLFAGKLHRAITFGLDVPSLLFADTNGKECGIPPSRTTTTTNNEGEKKDDKESTDANNKSIINNNNTDDDDVLASRLFETDILMECELDYNRVLGHRMVRALLARKDFSCTIVSTLLTEILGGCVLTPIMSLFSPDYINSWLIMGLEKNDNNNNNEKQQQEAENNNNNDTQQQQSKQQAESNISDDDASNINNKNTSTVSDNAHSDQESVKPAMVEDDDMHSIPTGLQSDDRSIDVLTPPPPPSPQMLIEPLNGDDFATMLATALIDLQTHVDLEECRIAKISNHDMNVNWDEPGCRAAVLRLVLVIEAALTHGRCTYRTRPSDTDVALNSLEQQSDENDNNVGGVMDDSERPVEVTLPEYESATFTQILMELTSDIEAFEERVASEEQLHREGTSKYDDDDMVAEEYHPTASEQSTLRTLIAAWLHKGEIYRTVSLLVQAHATILAPYYHPTSFLRTEDNAKGFVRQLRALTGVDIVVDTMTILSLPRLDELRNNEDLSAIIQDPSSPIIVSSPKREITNQDFGASILSAQFLSTSSTPRYLDFHRNESFAASLRSERERRAMSWERILAEDTEEGLPVIFHSKGATEENIAIHKDLHHIARIFYAGTNMLAIRDAARRKSVEAAAAAEGGGSTSQSVATPGATDGIRVSLMTIETACPRRRIEVPDDDSSFLLRAQPRPLNAVGVHRDQRNHDQSFKCFAGTYDEPALPVGTEHYTGGRFIRRCLVRYYPIDRTASIALQTDVRKLDQRRSQSSVPDTITLGGQSSRSAPFLSADFLKERHLCQRWIPKGTTRSQSLLASSVMEPTDFTATPRVGKALDFVYRMNLFERPMLDLGGKHFTVHDSASLGAHRADASALELSDASLSAALLILGSGDIGGLDGKSETPQGVEMGEDGYPVVWMKFSRKQDDAHVEVKPYRTSFVRAALMITAARQEAQLKSLIKCVKAGSAKKATKALTDAYLKPTAKLVEYAGSLSRAKQSLLLRDLKLGVNHIDREQLRRNALLSPRYPTELVELSAKVEDAVLSNDAQGVDLFGTASTVFRIKCSATVALVASDDELQGDSGYHTKDCMLAETYKEEWFIQRSLKEFQALHKHLKLQVSNSESSGTAGSRLVGAATAAFAATTVIQGVQGRSKQRQVLLPSLAQASKAGPLGMTKKLVLKRKEVLDGYLGYLLSPGHLLSRSSELLLFLGASFPLSNTVRVGIKTETPPDPLGRSEMTRAVLKSRSQSEKENRLPSPLPAQTRFSVRGISSGSAVSMDSDDEEFMDDDDEVDPLRKSGKNTNMILSVKSKIDKVKLGQVRNRVFELLRYQFGFDNASFARNRLLAALRTASLAVTSASEFRKTLYKLHIEHVNSSAIANWVNFLTDTLWPDGVFFESKPPLTPEELKAQAERSKELLHQSFPDQVRAILGQELTRDGMDIFHEMLQNRVVLKSMAYMLFDLLWLEVFPEIGDVLPCGAALDIDDVTV